MSYRFPMVLLTIRRIQVMTALRNSILKIPECDHLLAYEILLGFLTLRYKIKYTFTSKVPQIYTA